MKVLSKNFEDSRGYILDILYSQNFNHATIIYSKKGSIRGGLLVLPLVSVPVIVLLAPFGGLGFRAKGF